MPVRKPKLFFWGGISLEERFVNPPKLKKRRRTKLIDWLGDSETPISHTIKQEHLPHRQQTYSLFLGFVWKSSEHFPALHRLSGTLCQTNWGKLKTYLFSNATLKLIHFIYMYLSIKYVVIFFSFFSFPVTGAFEWFLNGIMCVLQVLCILIIIQ